MRAVRITITQTSVLNDVVMVSDEQFEKMISDGFDPEYDWSRVEGDSDHDTNFEYEDLKGTMEVNDRMSNVDRYIANLYSENVN